MNHKEKRQFFICDGMFQGIGIVNVFKRGQLVTLDFMLRTVAVDTWLGIRVHRVGVLLSGYQCCRLILVWSITQHRYGCLGYQVIRKWAGDVLLISKSGFGVFYGFR
jgi:hypothetical protein